MLLALVGPGFFPPLDVILAKAIACELRWLPAECPTPPPAAPASVTAATSDAPAVPGVDPSLPAFVPRADPAPPAAAPKEPAAETALAAVAMAPAAAAPEETAVTAGVAPTAAPAAAAPAAGAAPEASTSAAAGKRRQLPLLPLSRFSVNDVCGQLNDLGVPMSYSTVWRTLAKDAIRPWLHKQWLFPRDPKLLEKATPILGLYHRQWEGETLGPRDYVLCADEMTGLQAISRIHEPLPAGQKRRRRYEFEYKRHGTLCYLGFLDVFSGRVFGETAASTGIEPFEGALGRCLNQAPYRKAERLFLIVDNGSSHHPSTSPGRLRAQFPNLTVVHLPVHSSWLNQIEIYFSIVHRKALTPLDFESLEVLEQRLKWFQWRYNQYAQPFRWNYTHEKLEKLVERLAEKEDWLAEARRALLDLKASRQDMPEPAMN